jgi:hypothetical protein
MSKTSTITCRENRIAATITGDWVAGDTIAITVTGVTFAADGAYILALIAPGATSPDITAALALSVGDLVGSVALDTAEISAAFADYRLQIQDTVNKKVYVLQKQRIYRDRIAAVTA